MAFQVNDRQRRWLDALLVMGTTVVAIILIGYLGSIFFYFGDIILIFFLAWLMAFILSPIVAVLVRHVPNLPRIAAVVVVYGLLLVGQIPEIRNDLPDLLAPWQQRLNAIGFGQVDLAANANSLLSNLNTYASQ